MDEPVIDDSYGGDVVSDAVKKQRIDLEFQSTESPEEDGTDDAEVSFLDWTHEWYQSETALDRTCIPYAGVNIDAETEMRVFLLDTRELTALLSEKALDDPKPAWMASDRFRSDQALIVTTVGCTQLNSGARRKVGQSLDMPCY